MKKLYFVSFLMSGICFFNARAEIYSDNSHFFIISGESSYTSPTSTIFHSESYIDDFLLSACYECQGGYSNYGFDCNAMETWRGCDFVATRYEEWDETVGGETFELDPDKTYYFLYDDMMNYQYELDELTSENSSFEDGALTVNTDLWGEQILSDLKTSNGEAYMPKSNTSKTQTSESTGQNQPSGDSGQSANGVSNDVSENVNHHEGKRIYTVEEAEALSKPDGNTFRLRYK